MGVELEPTVDISCARYEYTGQLCTKLSARRTRISYDLNDIFFYIYPILLSLDVLLCHDDELEGRRVAFILYLVSPWQSSDGGSLDLYTTDSEPPI